MVLIFIYFIKTLNLSLSKLILKGLWSGIQVVRGFRFQIKVIYTFYNVTVVEVRRNWLSSIDESALILSFSLLVSCIQLVKVKPQLVEAKP